MWCLLDPLSSYDCDVTCQNLNKSWIHYSDDSANNRCEFFSVSAVAEHGTYRRTFVFISVVTILSKLWERLVLVISDMESLRVACLRKCCCRYSCSESPLAVCAQGFPLVMILLRFRKFTLIRWDLYKRDRQFTYNVVGACVQRFFL
jgi:hypothetical protein